MRLPAFLPRLSRKQRILRNLLAAALLAFLTWAAHDFQAPTANIALRWQAEAYGLPAPEVLYRGEWERDRRDVVFRAGGFYGTAREYKYGWWSYGTSEFAFAEDGGDVIPLLPARNYFGKMNVLYLYTEVPDAVRAACTLHTWTTAEQNYAYSEDWNETYTAEAEINPNGVCRFEFPLKWEGVTDMEERERRYLLWERSSVYTCRISLCFYDGEGNEVDTCEKTLWEAPEPE